MDYVRSRSRDQRDRVSRRSAGGCKERIRIKASTLYSRVDSAPSEAQRADPEEEHAGPDSLAAVFSAVHVRVDVDVGDVPVQDAPRSRDESVRQLRRDPHRVTAHTRTRSHTHQFQFFVSGHQDQVSWPRERKRTHAITLIFAIRPTLVNSNPDLMVRTEGHVNVTSPPPKGG
jgi:hypothetical protein